MTTRRLNALALEKLLGLMMLTGITVAALALVLGLAFWLLRPDTAAGTWLLRFGLITLMATPILRIAVAVAESIRLKDWFFVSTAAAVLFFLMLAVIKALSLAG